MKRYYLIYLIALFCSNCLLGEIYTSCDFTPYIHEYASSQIYEGDANENFKGDFTAILDDGSIWKIHPNHSEHLGRWEIGDKIHVELRTTLDSFEQEHKFILFNHQKDEGLYAMLIETPFVIDISGTPVSTTYPQSGFLREYRDYKKTLVLSDGSKCKINSYANDIRYSQKPPAYIGYNEVQKDFLDSKKKWGQFFIITGQGKDAQFEWTTPDSYR